MSFENLNLSASILKALKTEGYVHPTPIQKAAIPVILTKKDLLGCAQTGTGKTAAFALPILHLLESKAAVPAHQRKIAALILTPTRELAIQISESFASYGKHTGLKHQVVFGGVSAHSQITALKAGTDILVATPGRLLDLLSQNVVNLQHIQLFVLDEADRMLDMGFIHDVKKVISKLPHSRQTLFFSATMPNEIAGLANAILRNPVEVKVTPVSSTAESIKQAIYPVEKKDKAALLIHLLGNREMKSVLVFTRTKFGADKLAKLLNRSAIGADAIHGNKSQNARQKALKNFKDGTIRVLVATDIAARGIDVEELQYVINFELPNLPETYVHRIGRTGRAGNNGTALSFCDQEEQEYLRDINKLTAQNIPVVNEHPYLLPFRTPAKPQHATQPAFKKNFKHKRRNFAAAY
ncbi:DEAD/DEAH box helicase [Pedobacter sp. BS3]|uniref:DEAD/DEAH box helicase n=1 Tax=Pedobacter sp. BS3 TaxID=2567937 RepID=UPI0011ECE007|nr:DEAD/DEAH box helicase [Pedobacter sp. BS3]TZF83110.1 DEAD/DEAH box helicase [Pedobacter sp. BS3]